MSPENNGKLIKANAREVADIIHGTDTRVIVVVSAGGNDTKSLLASMGDLNPGADIGDHEVDIGVSAGETASVGRFGSALRGLGITDFRAYSAAEMPMRATTSDSSPHALVESVDGRAILDSLETNRVLIMPGFLATTSVGRLHTLGFGGSDLSAIVLAGGIQEQTRQRTPAIFGKGEKGVLAAPPKLVKNPGLISRATHYQCLRVITANADEFIAHRGAEVAMSLDVDMLFRQAACFIPKGQQRNFPGTLISARPNGTIEGKNGFRALAAKYFVRYDIPFNAQQIILNALEEYKIPHEEFKANPHGGFELFLPELKEKQESERNAKIQSLGLPVGEPKQVCVLHLMDPDILQAGKYFTTQVYASLVACGIDPNSKEFEDVQVTTEADSIFIECSKERASAVATAIARHFQLTEESTS